VPALAGAGLDDDVGVAQFRPPRDVDSGVGLAAKTADVLKRLVQVPLVQFAARTRGQRRAPPADGAQALHGRDAARQIPQRQRAGRQRLLGHDNPRGDQAVIEQQADQVFLQRAKPAAADAFAKHCHHGAGQACRRFSALPDDFPHGKARAFNR